MCRLGSTSAGTYPVLVSFPSLGDSRFSDSNFLFTYQLIVSSFFPLAGSVAGTTTILYVSHETPNSVRQLLLFFSSGGTLLTVRGFGFSQNATVTVGSAECTLIDSTDTELKCRTPAVSPHTANSFFIHSVYLQWHANKIAVVQCAEN